MENNIINYDTIILDKIINHSENNIYDNYLLLLISNIILFNK